MLVKTVQNLLDNLYHGSDNNFVVLTDKPYWSNKYHKYCTPSQYFSYTYQYSKSLIDNNHNWYTTLNMCHGSRISQHLTVILGFMADLDTNKAGITKFDLDKLLNFLPLTPTYVVFSGHGYHLLWLIKPFFVSSNPRYNKMTKQNYKKIEKWIGFYCDYWTYCNYGKKCFDYHCTDPLHELRIVGSYNVKDPNNPILCKTIKFTNKWYTFKQMLMTFTNYQSKQNNTQQQSCNKAKYFVLCRLHNDLNRLIYIRKHPIKKNKAPKHINNRLSKVENSNIKAINGLIHHIIQPTYNLYGHRDLAMFFYLCLLRQKEPNITTTQMINRFHWFINAVVKPKLQSEHKPLPTSYITKINHEIVYHNPWPYRTSYDVICTQMGFKNKLWTTKRDKRRYIKQRRTKRNNKIHRLYTNKHYSIRKIAKIMNLSNSAIDKILK